MHNRLIAIGLILASLLQGPALTYAVTLGASMGDSITHECGGQILTNGNDCEACCSHGSMPSCTAQCPVPVSAAALLTFPTSQQISVRGIIVPDLRVARFIEHDPPHPLRPPIV